MSASHLPQGDSTSLRDMEAGAAGAFAKAGLMRVAMEGERDPIRLSDGALERLLPATTWREAS